MPKKTVDLDARFSKVTALELLQERIVKLEENRAALLARVQDLENALDHLPDEEEYEEDVDSIRDMFAAAYIGGVAGHPMRAPNAVEWVNFAYEIADAAIARRRIPPPPAAVPPLEQR